MVSYIPKYLLMIYANTIGNRAIVNKCGPDSIIVFRLKLSDLKGSREKQRKNLKKS